jgi:hypothetical protein
MNAIAQLIAKDRAPKGAGRRESGIHHDEYYGPVDPVVVGWFRRQLDKTLKAAKKGRQMSRKKILNPDVLIAAYQHVETMIPRADDPIGLRWHGWALRESFIAGAKWQQDQPATPQRKPQKRRAG